MDGGVKNGYKLASCQRKHTQKKRCPRHVDTLLSVSPFLASIRRGKNCPRWAIKRIPHLENGWRKASGTPPPPSNQTFLHKQVIGRSPKKFNTALCSSSSTILTVSSRTWTHTHNTRTRTWGEGVSLPCYVCSGEVWHHVTATFLVDQFGDSSSNQKGERRVESYESLIVVIL